ncbi:MAG TPA: DUF2971 domain-containing protein [Bryobacteraceae bacterium]
MPDDTPIWRYMNLTKFLAMLVSKTLWFAKTKYLEDKYEGFAQAKGGEMPGNDRSAKCITRTTGEGVTDVISVPQAMVELSRSSAAYFENAREHLYVNSWCAGAESMAMWEIYGANGCGIAVKSSVGQYKRAARFEIREEQYAFGKVEYQDDPRFNPALSFDFSTGSIPVGSGLWERLLPVAFHKRICFEYEREWRGALYQDFRPDCYGCNIDFDLGELISAVYVGPRAGRFFFDVVGSVMDKFELAKPLEISALLESVQKKIAVSS